MVIYSSPVAFEVLEATLSLPNLFLYDKSIFHFSLNLSGVILYIYNKKVEALTNMAVSEASHI